MAPVPSGESSSTLITATSTGRTRISRRRFGKLSTSLYVGTTIKVRKSILHKEYNHRQPEPRIVQHTARFYQTAEEQCRQHQPGAETNYGDWLTKGGEWCKRNDSGVSAQRPNIRVPVAL